MEFIQVDTATDTTICTSSIPANVTDNSNMPGNARPNWSGDRFTEILADLNFDIDGDSTGIRNRKELMQFKPNMLILPDGNGNGDRNS